MKPAISILTFALFALSLPQISLAQKLPVEVAQAQLDAYNAQDIDAFAAVFADDEGSPYGKRQRCT